MSGQSEMNFQVDERLHEYGIFNEMSHFRAHVSPTTKTIYVYKTQEMVAHLAENKYPMRPASQTGVKHATAYGYIVPCNIPIIRPVCWQKGLEWWNDFSEKDDTTTKGEKAVNVVIALMKMGRFPFWVNPEEVADVKLDISGTDVIVAGTWKTQVKCDFRAGPKEHGGTGNLYVQTHECNPFKKY